MIDQRGSPVKKQPGFPLGASLLLLTGWVRSALHCHGVGCTEGHLRWARTGGRGPGPWGWVT